MLSSCCLAISIKPTTISSVSSWSDVLIFQILCCFGVYALVLAVLIRLAVVALFVLLARLIVLVAYPVRSTVAVRFVVVLFLPVVVLG